MSTYVENNIGGIVGGYGNTLINMQSESSMFDKAGLTHSKLTFGCSNIMFMTMVIKFIDPLTEQVERGMKNGGFPLRIKITDLVDYCANTAYHNGGNDEEEIEKMINGLFTLICTPRGIQYKAQIARVGLQYYFEMYSQNE